MLVPAPSTPKYNTPSHIRDGVWNASLVKVDNELLWVGKCLSHHVATEAKSLQYKSLSEMDTFFKHSFIFWKRNRTKYINFKLVLANNWDAKLDLKQCYAKINLLRLMVIIIDYLETKLFHSKYVGIASHPFRDCSGLRLLMSGLYPRSFALISSATKPTTLTYSAGTELNGRPNSASGPEPLGVRSPYSVWDYVHSWMSRLIKREWAEARVKEVIHSPLPRRQIELFRIDVRQLLVRQPAVSPGQSTHDISNALAPHTILVTPTMKHSSKTTGFEPARIVFTKLGDFSNFIIFFQVCDDCRSLLTKCQ